MDYFKDKVVLVTGSCRGIGFAVLRHVGLRGAKTVVTDILEEQSAAAAQSLAEQGIDTMARKCDVTVPRECEALVAAVIERFGRLDVLVNNAGVSVVDYFENCTYETAKKLMEVNLLGSIYMSLACLEELKRSRGHLIFVSSLSGIRSIPTGSLYGSSKAALRSLAEAVRVELKPHGVHVGVISPGFTTTDAAKTVMKGDGTARPINRPPHDTPEGAAKAIAMLIERRKREVVTTSFGKLGAFMQRLSPALVDRLIEGKEFKN